MPDPHTLTEEQRRLIELYRQAIYTRSENDHPSWRVLLRKYDTWSREQRVRWIYWLERQVEKDLPMAKALTADVMVLRLRGIAS